MTRRHVRALSGIVLALASLGVATAAQTPSTLTAANTSRELPNGRWQWVVFLRGSASELGSIQCVRYKLHPTLPNPVRDVCTQGSKDEAFRLEGEGFGVFEVGITVTFKDGRTRDLRRMLEFTARRGDVPEISVENIAAEVRKGWWSWEVFLVAPDAALAQVKCVEYTLHPTFTQPVQRVCSRGCGLQAFKLSGSGWGTFDIGVRVSLADGRQIALKHPLSFSGAALRRKLATLTLSQESYGTFALPQGRQGYVYVGDIEDEWRRKPVSLRVFVPGDTSSWGATGKLREAEFVQKLQRAGVENWAARMNCLGDALQFAVQGQRYVLGVAKVTPAPSQKDTIDVTIWQ